LVSTPRLLHHPPYPPFARGGKVITCDVVSVCNRNTCLEIVPPALSTLTFHRPGGWGGDWYLWHAPDGLRARAATALGCVQAGAGKLGVIEASYASAIIGVLSPVSSHWSGKPDAHSEAALDAIADLERLERCRSASSSWNPGTNCTPSPEQLPGTGLDEHGHGRCHPLSDTLKSWVAGFAIAWRRQPQERGNAQRSTRSAGLSPQRGRQMRGTRAGRPPGCDRTPPGLLALPPTSGARSHRCSGGKSWG